MSDRVVDEANPDNYLSTKDIHSLWDEEDILREIQYKEWDVQACSDKCAKLGDHVLSNVLLTLGQDSLSTGETFFPLKSRILDYDNFMIPHLLIKPFF